MVESWKITIPSLTGERERRAYVYLPVGYGEEGRRYPVLYMFDGHNLFYDSDATYGRSWRISQYLDDARTQLIVAAVECNTVGNGRLEEYSPVNFNFQGEYIRGRGKKYMEWLVKYFKPYIDANFSTLSDRANTAIGGSSMGGLMTLYALAAYNKYFSRGAALSPSLWMNGGSLNGFLEKAKFGRRTNLYMDYGSSEFANHAEQRSAYAATTALLIEKGVNVTSRVVEGGTHCEASWEERIPCFMNILGFLPEN